MARSVTALAALVLHPRPRRLQPLRQGHGPAQGLAGRRFLQGREAGIRHRELGRVHQDLRPARGEIPLRPLRAAGGARKRLCLLQDRRDRAVRLDAGQVHQGPPEPSRTSTTRCISRRWPTSRKTWGHCPGSSARTSPTAIPRPRANPSRASRTWWPDIPESKYVEDSRERMAYLVEALARHEVNVARYYLHRRAYLAAANRAQETIARFPNSPTRKRSARRS